MPTCVTTFGGYEGDVGWVEEATCGVTPTGVLKGFGYVQNVEPDYAKGLVKGRQVGSQKLAYQHQGKIEVSLTVEYVPVNRVLNDVFKYALGALTGHTNHLVTRSIERGLVRTDPAGQQRELFNLCKVNSLSMEAAVGEEWKFTVELLAQYMQHSTSKTYAGFQNVTVGASPAVETAEPIMFNDGNIKICRGESDTKTGITGTSTTTTQTAADVDGDTSYTDDIKVYINGINDVVVGYVPGTKTVTWTTPVLVTDTVVIEYFSLPIQLTDVTDISIEVNRNLEGQWGIKKGLPVAYEFVEKAFEVSASLTENFSSDDQIKEMLDDQEQYLYVGIGTKEVRLLRGKLEGPPGPYTPEDLVAVSIDAEFQDIVVA